MRYSPKLAGTMLLLALSGCALTSRDTLDFSGLKDVEGSGRGPHQYDQGRALHFGVVVPFIGDASLEGAVRDFTKEAKKEGAERDENRAVSPTKRRYGGFCHPSALFSRRDLLMWLEKRFWPTTTRRGRNRQNRRRRT